MQPSSSKPKKTTKAGAKQLAALRKKQAQRKKNLKQSKGKKK